MTKPLPAVANLSFFFGVVLSAGVTRSWLPLFLLIGWFGTEAVKWSRSR